ncbi:MAG: hypothetical protein DCC75_09520 [Proteobacteria bacterium]|nr:MAG: hypothetical protein DCC75_09520 [Pseudomonadota bacterium]
MIRQHLPAPLTPLIGREAELAIIEAILQGASTRLITITGAGGIGKTRLALELAHRLQRDSASRCSWVSLASVEGARDVPAALASALDVLIPAGQSALTALGEALEHREAVLFIDNFEHVSDAAPLLADLLQSGAGLGMIVTMFLLDPGLTLISIAVVVVLSLMANFWRIYARKAYIQVRETVRFHFRDKQRAFDEKVREMAETLLDKIEATQIEEWEKTKNYEKDLEDIFYITQMEGVNVEIGRRTKDWESSYRVVFFIDKLKNDKTGTSLARACFKRLEEREQDAQLSALDGVLDDIKFE